MFFKVVIIFSTMYAVLCLSSDSYESPRNFGKKSSRFDIHGGLSRGTRSRGGQKNYHGNGVGMGYGGGFGGFAGSSASSHGGGKAFGAGFGGFDSASSSGMGFASAGGENSHAIGAGFGRGVNGGKVGRGRGRGHYGGSHSGHGSVNKSARKPHITQRRIPMGKGVIQQRKSGYRRSNY